MLENPFVVGKYVSAEYFCDRVDETEKLIKNIVNGRNVALISPRRMGKSGLIEHTFLQPEISERYYTFFIDIYGTSSYAEFVYLMGKGIYDQLKSYQTRWKENFFQIIRSLQVGVQFDAMSGAPGLNLQLGDVTYPDTTLDEIFEYIEQADKPCIIAIDEFQKIMDYRDDTEVEAKLRTKIQHCKNAQFIFAGSKRHLMTQMFFSSAKPFYQSAISMGLESIPQATYQQFVVDKFAEYGKQIDAEVIESVYREYDGTTWFMQMIVNELFALTKKGDICHLDCLAEAIRNVIDSQDMAFRELMERVPTKQKQLLQAIAKAGVVKSITSGAFIRQYRLLSPSSVQSAAKALLASDLITLNDSQYRVYDYFLAQWLRTKY